MTRSRRRGRHHDERGTALVGSTAGVVVFLVLLLFAVQLLANLYATSTVSAAGLDAARAVASRHVDHHSDAAVQAAQRRAEADFRQLTGRLGDDARLTWSADAEHVRLHVAVDAPTILPRTLAGPLAFAHIERTYVVRVEDLP